VSFGVAGIEPDRHSEGVRSRAESVPIAGSYTTDKITSKLSPGDGDGVVVGVAAPVIIGFGSKPANKGAGRAIRHHHHHPA